MTEYKDNEKSELKEDEVYKVVVPNHTPEFNKELWYEIEEYLGEVTGVEIIQLHDQKYFNFQVNYKSNGVLKSDYYGNLKTLIASIIYIGEINSPMKKFKNSSKEIVFKTKKTS